MLPMGIEASDLRWHPRDLPGRRVIDGLSIAVPAGSVVALTGRNGSGKTTLLRVLAALLRPVSGSARVAGHEVSGHPGRVRRAVGLLPERDGLPDRMTPLWHVRYHALLRGSGWPQATRRAREILESLDLDEVVTAPIGTLSRGMRRRVAIGRALVHDPPVILLDEPDAHLDRDASASVRDLILKRRGAGCAVLVATHHPAWAGALCDRVCEMVDGRLREAGA